MKLTKIEIMPRRKRFDLTIYQQGVIIIICLSSFASCINFGLISPIEVVEEWGCHNSEIRLTCSHLDSTIAILEATFTPNCSKAFQNSSGGVDGRGGGDVKDDQLSNHNCALIDLKRFTPSHVSPKVDHRTSETVAGRRFLETLRQKHDEDEEIEAEPNAIVSASFAPSKSNSANDLKRKRMTLRASLEELIVEYLRNLAPDSDEFSDDRNRNERKRRSIPIDRSNVKDTSENTEKNSNIENESKVSDELITNENAEKRVHKKSADNISHVQTNENHTVADDDNKDQMMLKQNKSKASAKNVCAERRQRISQLDRSELNRALQNDSDYEHNIRRLLNYRCSGKNHCSFVFSDDHPLSILWKAGIVRIKYICMERYRVNKYCGEHLIIANESPVPDPTFQTPPQQRSISDDNETGKRPSIEDFNSENSSVEQDGPIAEALIQSDQTFHHLKILKSSPSDDEYERRQAAAAAEQFEKQSPRKGIYSQDFRMLKILPSNLDDFNDIEKIGDEFYFKKDEGVKRTEIDNSNTLQQQKGSDSDKSELIKNMLRTTIAAKTKSFEITKPDIDIDDDRNAIEKTAFDNSNNGLRDVRSTSGYDDLRQKLVTPHEWTSSSSSLASLSSLPHRTKAVDPLPTVAATASLQPTSSTTNPYLWENEILRQNQNVFDSMAIDNDDNSISNTNQQPNRTNSKLLEDMVKNYANEQLGKVVATSTVANAANDFSVINLNKNRADIERGSEENGSDEDYYASYEDYSVIIDGPKTLRKNKIRIHTSYQKTAIRQPLLQQGFIASPGYPKFYVGNSNCSWRITVPDEQRIQLIILDVDLRYDVICKDFLQILDIGSERVLFNSCAEQIMPLEILSETNELQISVKTTSLLAYPKRGVLIYYTAHGCILPTPPTNGRLVYKTENSIKFICDPLHVFPDTINGTRELICTLRNTWDKSLPNCIERSLVPSTQENPFIQSHWNQNHGGIKRKANETDALYDILIPSLLIVGLFIVNAFILFIIWRYRNKSRKDRLDNDGLAQL